MSYPTVLPSPVRSGYQAVALAPKQKTVMDDNSTRIRRKLLSNAIVFTLTWTLTDTQKAAFEGWFAYDHMYGHNWVDLPAIGTGGTIPIKSMDGNPSYSPEGVNLWTVSGRFLSRRPKYVLPPLTGKLLMWPTLLPQPEAKGFTATKVNPGSQSDISKITLPQTRRRFMTTVTQYKVTIFCEPAERDIFNDFHYNQLIDGACWFNMRIHNSVDNLPTRCRIIDEPAETPLDGIYQFTFTVETNDARIMSRAAYQEIAGTCDPQFHNNYSDCYFEQDYVE